MARRELEAQDKQRLMVRRSSYDRPRRKYDVTHIHIPRRLVDVSDYVTSNEPNASKLCVLIVKHYSYAGCIWASINDYGIMITSLHRKRNKESDQISLVNRINKKPLRVSWDTVQVLIVQVPGWQL